MLSVRYLTQKLRTQSLNEEPYSTKNDLDRDSGTESDDELPSTFASETDMDVPMNPEYGRKQYGGRERTRSESGKENSSPTLAGSSPASSSPSVSSSSSVHLASGRNRRKYRENEDDLMTATTTTSTHASFSVLLGHNNDTWRPESPLEGSSFAPATDSALPSDNDHPWGDQHSSEEELDHINNGPLAAVASHSQRYALHVLTPARRMLRSDGGLNEERVRRSRRGSSLSEEGRSTLMVISQPEKRKWSQVNTRKVKTPTSVIERRLPVVSVRTRSASALQHRSGPQAPRKHTDSSSASSDEEVQGLLHGTTADTEASPSPGLSAATVVSRGRTAPSSCSCTPVVPGVLEPQSPALSHALSSALPIPVQFCTSPPKGTHKPHQVQDMSLLARSVSPPPKLLHLAEDGTLTSSCGLVAPGTDGSEPYGALVGPSNGEETSQSTEAAVASPRKRHRHTGRAQHLQRPCLDFEKMQQMKAHSVTTWRHDGELSLFCW